MPTEFVAILDSGECRRLPLRQAIQHALSETFEQAAARLLNEDLERVRFGQVAYTPERGEEVWIIDPYEMPPSTAEALNNPRVLPPLSRAEVSDLRVKGVAACINQRNAAPWMALQALDRRQIIRARGLSIILDGDVFRQIEEPGLQLSDQVHVVLKNGVALFDQDRIARRLIDVSQYYREATDDDVDAFVASTAFVFESEDGFRQQADEWVRKRIALISDTGVLERCTPRQIREKAATYGIDVRIERANRREQVVLPAQKRAMKELLKFLGEDIFSGPLTDIQYVSNSKRRR